MIGPSALIRFVTFALQVGGNGFDPGVDQERGCNVFDQPQGCLFPDSYSPGLSAIPWIALLNQVYQFKVSCFGLFTALVSE